MLSSCSRRSASLVEGPTGAPYGGYFPGLQYSIKRYILSHPPGAPSTSEAPGGIFLFASAEKHSGRNAASFSDLARADYTDPQEPRYAISPAIAAEVPDRRWSSLNRLVE